MAPAVGSSDLLNTASVAQIINGPKLAKFSIKKQATHWEVVSARSLIGVFGQKICDVIGTDSNLSTSGTGAYVDHTSVACLIQSPQVMLAGTRLQVCVETEVTTGASAPTAGIRLQYGSVVLAAPAALSTMTSSVGPRTAEFCWKLRVLEAPSAARAVRFAVENYGTADATLGSAVATVQPVDIATNANGTIQVATQWSGAGGAGADTFTIKEMTIIRW